MITYDKCVTYGMLANGHYRIHEFIIGLITSSSGESCNVKEQNL